MHGRWLRCLHAWIFLFVQLFWHQIRDPKKSGCCGPFAIAARLLDGPCQSGLLLRRCVDAVAEDADAEL